MHSPMRAGSSVIIFINRIAPLLTLPIRRISFPEDRVKKQIEYFRARASKNRESGHGRDKIRKTPLFFKVAETDVTRQERDVATRTAYYSGFLSPFGGMR